MPGSDPAKIPAAGARRGGRAAGPAAPWLASSDLTGRPPRRDPRWQFGRDRAQSARLFLSGGRRAMAHRFPAGRVRIGVLGSCGPARMRARTPDAVPAPQSQSRSPPRPKPRPRRRPPGAISGPKNPGGRRLRAAADSKTNQTAGAIKRQPPGHSPGRNALAARQAKRSRPPIHTRCAGGQATVPGRPPA